MKRIFKPRNLLENYILNSGFFMGVWLFGAISVLGNVGIQISPDMLDSCILAAIGLVGALHEIKMAVKKAKEGGYLPPNSEKEPATP